MGIKSHIIMKKLSILLLLTCCLVPHVQATTLVVEHTDGQQSTFSLTDSPEITLSGADLVVKSGKSELRVGRSDLQHFYCTKKPMGIEELKADGVCARLTGSGTVYIVGVEPGDVHVFDINGRTARADISGTKEGLTVSITNNPAGVYTLKFSTYSLKIANK